MADNLVSPIVRVSTAADGSQANWWTDDWFTFSPDGSKVLFSTRASSLVSGDSNTYQDVFLKDLATGAISRVSTSASGSQADDGSAGAVFSPDGTKIAFLSLAGNLVAGDTNFESDIFVKTLATGAITRVSTNSSGAEANFSSLGPVAFSPDGTKLLFTSFATNLVPGTTSPTWSDMPRLYLKDLSTGAISMVADSGSNYNPLIGVFTPDGANYLIQTDDGYVASDTNPFVDIYLKNATTGAWTLLSGGIGGFAADGSSAQMSISADGTRVLFASDATNLVAGDTNGAVDVFVKTLSTGAITRVSNNVSGVQGDNDSENARFSPDGSKVVFESAAANLIAGDLDSNGLKDIFVKDLATGDVTRVSTTAAGGQASPFESSFATFTPDGSKIAFLSGATNLVAGDTNTYRDLFLKDWSVTQPTLPTASVSDAAPVSEGTSLVFTITLNAAPTVATTVNFTIGGTAQLVADVGGASSLGSVTFAPGQMSRTWTLPTLADGVYEPSETLTLTLTAASNIQLGDAFGVGVINNVRANTPNLAAQNNSQSAIDWAAAIDTGSLMSLLSYGDEAFGPNQATHTGAADSGFDDFYTNYFSSNVVQAGHDWRILSGFGAGPNAVAHSFGAYWHQQAIAATAANALFTTGGLYHAYLPGSDQYHTTGVLGSGTTYGNSNAIVAIDQTTHTLALTFRGTDGEDEAVDAGQTFDPDGNYNHYEAFRPLIEATLAFAADPANNVAHIVVSGHSLGGQMVDLFAAMDARYFAAIPFSDLALISLASPGLLVDGFTNTGEAKRFAGYDASVVTFDSGVPTPLTLAKPGSFYQGLAQDRDRVYWAEKPESFLLEDIGLAGILYFSPNYPIADNINMPAVEFTLANIQNDDVYYGIEPPVRGFGAHHNGTIYQHNAHAWSTSRFFAPDQTQKLIFGVGNYTRMGDWFVGDPIHDSGTRAIQGSADPDFIFGLEGDDLLYGNGANDLLDGGTGADTLDGGAGVDQMDGGVGNDVYVVDTASDKVFEEAAAGFGNDTLRTSVFGLDLNSVLWANIENAELTGSGNLNLTGNAGANRLTGNTGNNLLNAGNGTDTVVGGDGNDTVRGGTSDGNDTMTGGAGFDVLDYSAVGGVVSVNQFAGIVTGSAGNDTLTDIFEQVIGTAFADVLAGGNGVNVLDGNGGNDHLYGNGGQDLLRGGNDNDTFYGQTADGNDTIEGGAGFDLITFATAGGVIQLNMFTNSSTGTAGNDSFTGIEYVIGSNFGDIIAGNNGVNAFEGGGGADQLYGNGGIDWMRGGLGNDTATLGTGNDTWYFVNGDGVDTINDFVAGGTDDKIDLTTAATGYASFAAMQAFAGAILQSGADTFLNLDPGGGSTDRIVLKNVTATNLTAADFAF